MKPKLIFGIPYKCYDVMKWKTTLYEINKKVKYRLIAFEKQMWGSLPKTKNNQSVFIKNVKFEIWKLLSLFCEVTS